VPVVRNGPRGGAVGWHRVLRCTLERVSPPPHGLRYGTRGLPPQLPCSPPVPSREVDGQPSDERLRLGGRAFRLGGVWRERSASRGPAARVRGSALRDTGRRTLRRGCSNGTRAVAGRPVAALTSERRSVGSRPQSTRSPCAKPQARCGRGRFSRAWCTDSASSRWLRWGAAAQPKRSAYHV
jgi:hypothetical protein